jgi:hypothetical protein
MQLSLLCPHSRRITPVFSFVWLHTIAPVTHQDQAQWHLLPIRPGGCEAAPEKRWYRPASKQLKLTDLWLSIIRRQS